MSLRSVFKAMVLAACVLGPSSAQAAPPADLWPFWLPHEPASTKTVDHRAWGAILKRHVMMASDGTARFSYGRVTPEERSALDEYLERMSLVLVRELSRDEQRAFWINLYNAVTVKAILDRYPVHSIKDIDISFGFVRVGPWRKKLTSVEGEALSLDDIEHRILRPIWKDPRIHYAVNCAAIGCPNLQPEAFTAANTERLLEKAAAEYVNHPRGAHFDGDKLIVSSIYVWFQSDFGGHEGDVIAHLARYAESDLKEKLHRMRFIADHHYEWALNDTAQ